MCEQESSRDVAETVRQLVGKPVWGATVTIGSFLALEFGRRVQALDRSPAPSGEWRLWLDGCVWRIEDGREVVVASEDSTEALRAAVCRLDGRILESVSLDSPANDAIWRFDNGLVLRVFAIFSSRTESWDLFTPYGKVLVVGPGSCVAWRISKPRIALVDEGEHSARTQSSAQAN
jgi:hypothetical protein